MGICYLGIAYTRFINKPIFLVEHLFVLAFWIANTAILMMVSREIFIRLHLRFVFISTVVIPTLSWFLLYCIYICSLIGNFCWDSNFTYHQFVHFVPYLFQVTDDFNIPRFLVIGILVIPLTAMAIIYSFGSKEIIMWHWVVKEIFYQLRISRLWLALAVLLWMVSWVNLIMANPTIILFGNFSHDPVVTFFKDSPGSRSMTRERLYWVSKDQQAEKLIRFRVPRVHNVFLFVVDALRADHLPLYGYSRPLTPFLSEFLPKAYFRKIDWGLSDGLETGTGLMSLLTSKEPLCASKLNLTLPDLMTDQGFRSSLILAGDHSGFLSKKSFGRKIDFIYDGGDHPGPDGVFDDKLLVDEVANLMPDDGGYHFFYIHLISVHQAGHLDEKYLQYQPSRNFIDPKFSPTYRVNNDDIQEIVNMYDDRILQMDDIFKKILTLLQQKGYLKDYVAVWTADHGQLLGDRGDFGHGYYAPIGAIHVPMVFFGSKPLPDFPETHFGIQMDIAPTLADLAGIGIPFSWQGQSLLKKRKNPWSYHYTPSERPGEEGAVVYDGPDKLLKYTRVLDPSKDDPGTLFDLDRDPQETRDLVKGFDPNFLAQVRSQAHEHFSVY
jgi:glucan phosphoethanolaminetransferase (alkaline phosphatase superfamily)